MGVSMSRGRQDDCPGQTLPLLALLMLLKYGPAGASRPPVTAALIAGNALVYFRPGALDAHLPQLRRVMFNPHLIIKFGDLRRFFLSAFYHLNEAHFFMNMTSLLWKGVQLETSMGSSEFASMVVSLIGLSQGFTLLLSKGLLFLGNDVPYYQYSAGLSGVVLGMKVVLNAQAGDVVCFGVVIPSKYVVLLELLLVQAFNPEAHLIGNVGIADIVSQPVRFARRLLRSTDHRRGRSVRLHAAPVPRETGQGMWRCTACSNDNSRCTDVCEMCSTPHPDHAFSRRQQLHDSGNSELSVEEIRRRRLQRFEK